jgi:hypothetical protein
LLGDVVGRVTVKMRVKVKVKVKVGQWGWDGTSNGAFCKRPKATYYSLIK